MDVVVHFSRTYISALIMILQVFAVGWALDFKEAKKKIGTASLVIYGLGYWTLIVINP